MKRRCSALANWNLVVLLVLCTYTSAGNDANSPQFAGESPFDYFTGTFIEAKVCLTVQKFTFMQYYY